MPEAIVTRILRLAGYAVYAHGVEETASKLILWVRQAAADPYYVCGGCGISIRDVHSWTERRVRDLPWGTWQVWLVLEVHRVRGPEDVKSDETVGLTSSALPTGSSWGRVASMATGSPTSCGDTPRERSPCG